MPQTHIGTQMTLIKQMNADFFFVINRIKSAIIRLFCVICVPFAYYYTPTEITIKVIIIKYFPS